MRSLVYARPNGGNKARWLPTAAEKEAQRRQKHLEEMRAVYREPAPLLVPVPHVDVGIYDKILDKKTYKTRAMASIMYVYDS
ncbi:hypothetical protein BJ508DRAFT_336689 [Ascobolus immersus RN42]|uniref:Uncharacterized protein n=1 Tax=Ascobolus immersus RN42 TaxID=1160509 RepID=A0A3N4H7P8_ASCIM|nr:hypothetical protein BJ508DRAFT_336689 [Ascobolus immersus RN42]